MDEHSVVSMGDSQIEVVDNPTGHRFTFSVVEHPQTGGRMLSDSASCRVNQTAHLDERAVGGRARNFAQMEMLKAGKVDRTNP